MPSYNKLSNYRTTWQTKGETGSVIYVHTEIVRWDENAITLNSGGWQTVTTKRKMCQAARQFCLNFNVYQKKGEWFVARYWWINGDCIHEEGVPFFDGMTIKRDAKPSLSVAA